MKPKLQQLRDSDFFATLPPQRILAVGVQSPRRPGSLDQIYAAMQSSRHSVTVDSKGIDGLGKLDNINVLIGRHRMEDYDWIWMVDDDVELPAGFTDTFVALAHYAELKICCPAHRSFSYWSHPVTHRQRDTLVRETNFVEVGPITAFHRDTFSTIFPLPSLRFGWGLDLVWPVIANRNGWKVGVVDGAALRHTSPIAATYDFESATAEAEAFIKPYGIVTGVHKLVTMDRITSIQDRTAAA